MKRLLAVVVLLLLFSVTVFADQHIVRFTNGVPANFDKTVAALGGTVSTQHSVMAVVKGLTPAAAITLGGSTGVVEVIPDAVISLDDAVATAEPIGTIASATNPAGAFFFPRQWHHRAIGADKAWGAGRLGSPAVTVAIIDTGIDYKYIDLQGRVDLTRSKSFVPADDALVTTLFPTRNLVTDLNFHGTHVASTVASNALAVAGVTSRTTLIGVKVLDVNGHGFFSDILNGILFAADQGADVANMSLGGGFAKTASGQFLGTVNQVFNYAHRKGMLVVVSAGNDAADLDHNGNFMVLNCNAANVLCVAATGPTASEGINGAFFNVDNPAPYTNFGRSSIDVAAPGGTSAALVWEACSTSSLVVPICQTGTFTLGATGTSMATPHVTGLAALLVEDIGHGKPSQIKARILQGADDLGQPGTDPFYGKGRINVPKTLGIQ